MYYNTLGMKKKSTRIIVTVFTWKSVLAFSFLVNIMFVDTRDSRCNACACYLIIVHMLVRLRSFACSTSNFYTHPHGYQMCVEVNPYGTGGGKGTHVSIFTYLMKGP